ncbi:extracellular solute-binding protein [Phototrophicus methaneseepsis]|uniref:Extracellular solute-binding protein n=1 Tax=Phototrophicus methaneseepsis TaxID=2710758 RepID=A0A7S8EDY7_9CHLR|nr:extracellular solute-binding protein [Phototrophicus methaneseepsis]QPC85225.1 extracellular solute-binding protein [Phototrophicus methaneseepsis]
MSKYKLSRRDFLRTAATATAGMFAANAVPFVARAQDTTTIRLLAWGNPTEFEAREATIAMFEEAFPNIKVEFLHTPDDYNTKLQTMLAGGDYPDVIYIGNGDVLPYVARGQFEPLDAYIERDSFDTSDIFAANLALYNVDGVQYGFPMDAPSQQLFYNVTRFEEAGVERPPSDWEDETWTWDSFLEKAIALTDKSQNKWGFQVKNDFRSNWIWITSNGGSFFNEDGTACVINEPEAVEALQFLADLIHVHEVAPPLDVASEMGSATLFESGITAMETWWPAMGRMRESIGDKFVWDVAPHPAGKAGKSTAGGGSGQVISAFSPNKDAAWEFVKFMATTEAAEKWTEIMGIVPPLQSVAESDVYLQPGQPPEHISVFTEGAPYLHPDPRNAAFTQASQVMITELDRLWIGQADAQEVADTIVEKVNDLL